ncbi:MAG TPA: hypothetical protein VI814_11320 [Candidatus Limnocylindria bacterium]
MSAPRLRFVVSFIASLAIVMSLAVPAAARPRYSEWSVPIWMGATLNTSAVDFGPGTSRDGLTLYFTSTRGGGVGGEDIWVSYRASTEAPWETPANLTPLNTTGSDRVPALSRDGHWMFFASDRSGSLGNSDLWASYRLHTDEDFGEFGWQTPVNLTSLNSTSYDVGPAFFFDDETATGYLFFASDRPGGAGSHDIYQAVQQPDGSFANVTNVTELNSTGQDARPTLSHDGLEIIFHRADASGTHLWSATRASVGSPWTAPTKIEQLASAGTDVQPSISADGMTLYFGSSRAGGSGMADLWMSTRTKVTGKP